MFLERSLSGVYLYPFLTVQISHHTGIISQNYSYSKCQYAENNFRVLSETREYVERDGSCKWVIDY